MFKYKNTLTPLFIVLLLLQSISCKKDIIEWNSTKYHSSFYPGPNSNHIGKYLLGNDPDTLVFFRHYKKDSLQISDTNRWIKIDEYNINTIAFRVFDIDNNLSNTILTGTPTWFGVNTRDSIYTQIRFGGRILILFDYFHTFYGSGKRSNSFVSGNSQVTVSTFAPMVNETISGKERKAIHARIDSVNSSSIFIFSTDLYFIDSIGLYRLDFNKVSRLSNDTVEQYRLVRDVTR